MSKSFQLVGVERPVPSRSTHTTQTKWKLCIICQEDKSESLTSPSMSTRKDSGSGYSSFAANLRRFSELRQLPGTLQLERLNEGCGIEAAMVANNALYHQACKLKYNNTKLQRAEKRTFDTEGEINDAPGAAPDSHQISFKIVQYRGGPRSPVFLLQTTCWNRWSSRSCNISNGQ